MTALPAIVRRFENQSQTFALDMPAIELQPGDLNFLVGPNGSGKSLYLRTLAGDPVEGAGAWSSARQSDRASAVLVKQSFDENLSLSLTAIENLAIWCGPTTVADWLSPTRRLTKLMAEIESEFPALKGAWHREVETLSGGQKQALAIAARAQSDAHLLLLDEVTSAMDALASKELLKLTQALARQPRRHVLIVDHDIVEVAEFATRILAIASGKLLLDLRKRDRGGFSARDVAEILTRAWHAQMETLSSGGA